MRTLKRHPTRKSLGVSETSPAQSTLQLMITTASLILAIALLLQGPGASIVQPALASGETVSLWKDGSIDYSDGSWNTHKFRANDGAGDTVAYCVEPSKTSPGEGDYSKSPISTISGREAEMRTDLWFAYGGPGFDASMWPPVNWNGEPMSSDDYYLASHIWLADTYSSSAYDATYGASESFSDWLTLYITGFDINTGELKNSNAVGRRAYARSGEVPSDFATYQIDGGDSQTIAMSSYYNPTGTIKINKTSANDQITNGNPCYSLEGIIYGIYTNADCNGSTHGTGKSLVLNADGYAEAEDLHAGTYFIREVESSVTGRGYAYNSTIYTCEVKGGQDAWIHDTASTAGDTHGNDVSDKPISLSPSVLISKYDILTRGSIPSGSAPLADALFEVSYFANLDGETSGTPIRTWVFKTDAAGKVDLRSNLQASFVRGDALFFCADGSCAFPLGTYRIVETAVPASYEFPKENSPTVFTVRANGTGEHDTTAGETLGADGVTIWETPIRQDISFAKRDLDTQRPMSGIPFLVTRIGPDGVTPIERHVIVTDANGVFNSNTNHVEHTTRTNANDAALRTDMTGAYIVDETRLDADAGTWFGVTANGGWIDPRSDYGALPDSSTCKYLFEELPVAANAGKALVSFEAYAHAAHATTIDLGTVGNLTPTIATTAYDAADGDKIISRDMDAHLNDTVSYSGLVAGHSYTVNGWLVDAGSGLALPSSDGSPVTSHATFTAPATNGTLELPFVFDASVVSDGARIVVCETLFEGDRVLARHEDLDDASQSATVVQPAIATSACDATDGDARVIKDVDTTVLDHVTFTGLAPGATYTLTGTIMDKKTGQPYIASGAPISTSASFAPQESHGTVDMAFTFDATGLDSGTELVVFEKLTRGDREIATHEDISDEGQTVTVFPPRIETSVADQADGDQIASADIETTILDTVSYSGLQPGREYTMKGALVEKQTGRPITDPFGQQVTASRTFAPITSDGSVDIPFVFDASNTNVATVGVVFEELYRDGRKLASHIDIEDALQSIVIEQPSMQSTASGDDMSKTIARDDGVTLNDFVAFRGLKPKTTYQLIGTVMDKQSGTVLRKRDGSTVSSTMQFSPESSDGVAHMSFSLDATVVDEGAELVVFERLSRAGVKLARHEDLDDAGQTVTIAIPQIKTSAVSQDNTKTVVRDTDAHIIDTVSYANLMPAAEYTLVATLMDKTTGQPLTDASGNVPTASATFTPEHANGEFPLTVTFDASSLEAGSELVVFEKLFRDGIEITKHEDIADEGQTVCVQPPDISTSASDPEDGDREISAGDGTRILDAVSYRGLQPGASYTIVGTLMDKEAGQPLLDAQGKTIQSTQSFIPDKTDGTTEVAFRYDASLDNTTQTAVVFENLYRDEKLIASHENLDNASQTVIASLPNIQTSAIDKADADKVIMRGRVATITDTVAYTGLKPGEEYELTGTLMVNDGTLAGTPALDAFGNPISAQAKFTPETAHGSIELDFEIDTTIMDNDADVVVFETLLRAGSTLATHADLADEGQTVHIVSPTLETHASDASDGDSELAATLDCKIIDAVTYTGLECGREYIIAGTLMDKTDGSPLLVDDRPVTVKARFVATRESGSADVCFELDARRIAGHDLVAFEQLLDASGSRLIAHENLEDKRQTVHVADKTSSGFSRVLGNIVKTGDESLLAFAACGCIAALVLGSLFFFRRRFLGGDADK